MLVKSNGTDFQTFVRQVISPAQELKSIQRPDSPNEASSEAVIVEVVLQQVARKLGLDV
jgi:hypothetical protein